MVAETRFKMPFNYVQILIAAFGAASICTFIYFVAGAAGASMNFTGGLFEHLAFIEVIRFTVMPIVVLGFLTWVIGRARPGFCKIAQWVGVAVVVLAIINPIMFAADLASGIALALMHLIVGGSWYLAVNYSNRKYNEAAARDH